MVQGVCKRVWNGTCKRRGNMVYYQRNKAAERAYAYLRIRGAEDEL